MRRLLSVPVGLFLSLSAVMGLEPPKLTLDKLAEEGRIDASVLWFKARDNFPLSVSKELLFQAVGDSVDVKVVPALENPNLRRRYRAMEVLRMNGENTVLFHVRVLEETRDRHCLEFEGMREDLYKLICDPGWSITEIWSGTGYSVLPDVATGLKKAVVDYLRRNRVRTLYIELPGNLDP